MLKRNGQNSYWYENIGMKTSDARVCRAHAQLIPNAVELSCSEFEIPYYSGMKNVIGTVPHSGNPHFTAQVD
ncbi:hypothetical protein IVA79_00885 [Bradyrhizobium sp. 138]|uniref:hypothetical protein n=1 Tax=Bradyrhizobium sp. 138 TaxID=2782615 RepID=UPI001FF8B923|nr:hypothetical protein [Bradyrhizobium sp. 138]MCK1732537.1 hypothetical protein [Bradyrhizobium sp. 138]